METCSIEGCGRPKYATTLCSKHYNRLLTTGTTDDGPRARKTLSERFWGKVERRGDDECWPWTGNSWTYGYGSISSGGRNEKKHTSNRVAWMLTNGDIPDGLVVRHKCHNRACCNPSHLLLGSRADNVMDMWEREEGAPKGNARLTESQVLEIRDSKQPRSILAGQYGVSCSHIKAIQLKRAWNNL